MQEPPLVSRDPAVLAHTDENQYFDRKSSRIKPADLARTIIAFANASGGRIAIGIEDNGEITGFSSLDQSKINELRETPRNYCTPVPQVAFTTIPTNNSKGLEDEIVVLDVQVSATQIIKHRNNNEVFLRIGDQSKKLDYEQIRSLEYDKNQRCFEDEPCRGAGFDDLNMEVFAKFQKHLNTDSSIEQILRSRNFLQNGILSNAAILLFGNNPGKFFPQARVRVLRFEGTQMRTGSQFNLTKDQTFDGPIPSIIESASILISSMLRDFQYLGEDGKFLTIPEYPEFAWFEGLVNAVTHRDYSLFGDHIRVSMYDDRLEITSPGKLPNTVTLSNLKNTRFSRNPRIARTLAEFGWVRELNEGVQRIYNEMQSAYLNEPAYSEPNDISVKLVLENSITSRVLRNEDAIQNKIPTEVYDNLNEYEIIAVQLVYSKRKITVSQFADKIQRSLNFSRKILRGLLDKEILKWHGAGLNDPSQYYSLNA